MFTFGGFVHTGEAKCRLGDGFANYLHSLCRGDPELLTAHPTPSLMYYWSVASCTITVRPRANLKEDTLSSIWARYCFLSSIELNKCSTLISQSLSSIVILAQLVVFSSLGAEDVSRLTCRACPPAPHLTTPSFFCLRYILSLFSLSNCSHSLLLTAYPQWFHPDQSTLPAAFQAYLLPISDAAWRGEYFRHFLFLFQLFNDIICILSGLQFMKFTEAILFHTNVLLHQKQHLGEIVCSCTYINYLKKSRIP